MADAHVPPTGRDAPPIPLLLDSETTSSAGRLYVPRVTAGQATVWLALTVTLIVIHLVLSTFESDTMKRLVFRNAHVDAHVVALSCWQRMVFWLRIPAFAACLVATGVLVRCRCLRMLVRLQPGHWLVLIIATAGTLACVGRGVDCLRMLHHLLPLSARPASDAVSWLNMAVTGGMFALAAICVLDAARWNILFASGAANVLFWAVLFIPFPQRTASVLTQAQLRALPWWQAGVAVVALVVMALDWPQRARRDWVHWLGASLWTFGALATVAANWRLFTQ